MLRDKPDYNKNLTLSEYISEKIYMLNNEFYLRLTDEEELHFRELKHEYEVDAYAHKLLVDKL